MTNQMTVSEADRLATYILRDVNDLYETVEQLARDREEYFMVSNKMRELDVLETMGSKLNTSDRMGEKLGAMIYQIRYVASFNWPEKFSV